MEEKMSGLIRMMENKAFRIGVCVFLILLMLVNIVFSGLSIHVSAKGLSGVLGYQIVLSLGTALLCMLVLWRSLDSVSRKTARLYYWLSVLMCFLWAAAFLSFVIMSVKVKEPDEKDDSSDTSGSTKMLMRRASSSSSFDPRIAVGFFSGFTCAMFIFHTIYVHLRYRMLYPKYAELHYASDEVAVEAQDRPNEMSGVYQEEVHH